MNALKDNTISEEKLKNQKLESWREHYSLAKEREHYSITRIDLLIISISGACIYIVFQILQFLNSPSADNLCQSTILLKLSAIVSVFAIATNFVSQITGYLANKYEALYSQRTIDQLIRDMEDESELTPIDKKERCFSKWTHILNIMSAVIMTIGIIMLVIYNLITF
jgi:hypothetical protein